MNQNGSTRVVMLGTGTPRPDPNRCPATAIMVDDTPYLIDFGAGIVRGIANVTNKPGMGQFQPRAVSPLV